MSSVMTRVGVAGWGSTEGESALAREDFLEEEAQLPWDEENGEQLTRQNRGAWVGGRHEF